MLDALHPAPVSTHKADHREVENRAQLREPTELLAIWKRTVENLAVELQIEPIEANALLRDAGWEVTKGLAWHWWL